MISMKQICLSALCGGVAFALSAAKPEAPRSLLTEHLQNPLGVNTLTPRFSWKNSGKDFRVQGAYEIVVGTDSATVASGNKADLWNSGRVASGESHLVEYAGAALHPRTQAWWKVRVWNQDGDRSPWSAVQRFGIGITPDAPLPMQGCYMAMGTPASEGSDAPMLRRTLTLGTISGKAMAHVSSMGYHELYVNGVKAGTNVLSPGMSQIDKRALIVTYDITPLLREGDNDIVLWLGRGWFRPNTFKADYDGPLAMIEIDEVSGNNSRTLLSGDSKWLSASVARSYTGNWFPLQFGGERVDGRKAPADMSAASLDRLEWVPVATPTIASRTLTPEMAGSNRVVKTVDAVKVTPLSDGTFMADMGRVYTGWFAMEMPPLPSGTEVTMEYSDNLTPAGEFDPQGEADVYVAAGGSGEKFCNKFHHHAFRYVKLKGLNEAPAPSTLHAHQIHGEYNPASSFQCSDPDLNAIHDMVNHTMQCLTFSGYMVDCPHLERMGYGGDGNSSTITLQTMYDVAPTYVNWIQAWGDVVDPDGSLPHVAPAGGGGGGPYWCAFFVFSSWRTWLNYGDRRVLETYYPLMKKWMGYVDAYTRDGLLRRWPDTHNRGWYLGDWLAPMGVDAGNERSVDLVNNCVVSESLQRMEQIAQVLGLADDAAQWRSRRQALNAKIHYTFFDHTTGEYSTGSQLDMCYPMLVGVTPEELRSAVAATNLRLTRDRFRGHIGAGLVGIPILTEWTVAERQPDFMASMLRHRDYPGYLHMIDNGATATWEYWSGERSRVHNCYNGIGTWFYQALGGILPDASSPAYRHFFIDPQPAQGVEWAEVTKETPYGTIALRWDRTPAGFTYAVEVPPGTTATVKIPAGLIPSEVYATSSTGLTLQAGKHNISFTK